MLSIGTISVSKLKAESPVNTDVLVVAVQNYITAIVLFLIVEMLMTWGFYGRQHPPDLAYVY